MSRDCSLPLGETKKSCGNDTCHFSPQDFYRTNKEIRFSIVSNDLSLAFNQPNETWEVVAVAVSPDARGVGAERITFILAVLGTKEVAIEDSRCEIGQSVIDAFLFLQEIVADENLVEKVPLVVVSE